MDFVLRSAAKVRGEYGINRGNKTILDLYCANDLSFLDENVATID